jgi:hypothetical protein
VSFVAITLCVASQRVFIVVVYFVIDSVRILLDTLLYTYFDITLAVTSRDSSVSTVTGLWALQYRVGTGSGIHPTS